MRKIEDFLTSRDTYTTTLLAILIDKYGTEALEWDPMTVEMQLKDDFSIDVPGYTLDKIQAGASLLTSNLFHVSLETFLPVCSTLSRGVAITTDLVPVNLMDMAWGITEANLLEGPEFWQEGFGHSIARYAGVILDQEGIYEPPKILKFAEYEDGLLDRNAAALVDGDELFYKFYYDRQRESANQINFAIRQKLEKLLQELEEVPLQSKDTSYIDRIKQAMLPTG